MTPELVSSAAQFGLPGVALIVLGGSALKYAADFLRTRFERKANAPSPAQLKLSEVDASILAMAKQREQFLREREVERREATRALVAEREESAQLRRELADERDRGRRALAEEEARNAAREAALRQEVEHLESKLRALLDELQSLKHRHGFTTRATDADH